MAARDPAKAIARLKQPVVRELVAGVLARPIDPFEDPPIPQRVLRGDAWTGVVTAVDPDGWRAVLVTAGGRRSASRSCTLIDPEGAVVCAFPADDATRRAAAAAAGLAAARITRPGPLRVAVLGTGPLGLGCLEAVRAAVEVADVRLHDPDRAVLAAAADHGDARADAQSAVRDAALIITATNARDPVLRADWVAEGASVIAAGADRPGRRELDYRLIAEASFVACDAPRIARALADDLRDCVAEGHLDWQEVTPLGTVLSGDVDARVADDDLVVVKLIDPAPAVLALARRALGT
jgi:ornithine cyclodeaminase/alanine dehydrogenase-like protein (mu-crystallin family)